MTANRLTRREWIATLVRTMTGAAAIAVVTPSILRAAPEAPRRIVVYKDPDCGCCREWVKHLAANGFAPEAHDRGDMDALKDSLGVPAALRSCHTAVAGRYVIEGHVPAADIARLLSMSPTKVAGLAVPGMPAGAPGMEMGARHDHYNVMAFSATGASHVFASHR